MDLRDSTMEHRSASTYLIIELPSIWNASNDQFFSVAANLSAVDDFSEVNTAFSSVESALSGI